MEPDWCNLLEAIWKKCEFKVAYHMFLPQNLTAPWLKGLWNSITGTRKLQQSLPLWWILSNLTCFCLALFLIRAWAPLQGSAAQHEGDDHRGSKWQHIKQQRCAQLHISHHTSKTEVAGVRWTYLHPTRKTSEAGELVCIWRFLHHKNQSFNLCLLICSEHQN